MCGVVVCVGLVRGTYVGLVWGGSCVCVEVCVFGMCLCGEV